ncbi:MAG: hypothetical protein HRU41_27775 [Saprospiraceae bacterium]|nr:hypothetical protein [Saprospiraceae bacterium]
MSPRNNGDPMQVTEKIDNIELKIRQLAQKVDRLNEENNSLKAENERLKTDLDKQKGAVLTLKNKLDKTQGMLDTQHVSETADSEQLKKQLDQYIKEIDKCIEWLSNNP